MSNLVKHIFPTVAQSARDMIDNADFTTIRETDGTHRVQMRIADGGLSATDIATLDALGWANLGDAP